MTVMTPRSSARIACRAATLVVALTLALAGGDAYAEDEEAWTALSSGVFVSAAEAERRVQAGALLLDARDEAAFTREHLDGARSVPWRAWAEAGQRGELLADDNALGALIAAAGVTAAREVVVVGAWRGTPNDPSWGEEGRLWWALRHVGHDEVSVLYGGWRAARDHGWPTRRGEAPQASGHSAPSPYPVAREPRLRAETPDVLDAATRGALLDVRTPLEFAGATPHGEARGGHVPGARSAWWLRLFDARGRLRPPSEVRGLFEAWGVRDDAPSVAYCTGGVRSGFVVMVAHALGYPMANHDASMWGWSADDSLPLD